MSRTTVLAVRNTDTGSHRIVGVFTQKKKLWEAMEVYGLTTDTEIITENDDRPQKMIYQYLCNAIRKAGYTGMVAIKNESDEKLALITEVEVNEIPTPGELFDVRE